jgi:hypothetical protein
MHSPHVLYIRELPGGGLVTIEELSSSRSACRARVTVERRRDPVRREGHQPPVIAEAVAPSRSVAFQQLYQIASDNVAVAHGLIRWQAGKG